MIINYLFSKYFATSLIISIIFQFLLLPYATTTLAIPLFLSLFFVNTITIHLFLYRKKLTQFLELPRNNFSFSFSFVFYIFSIMLLGAVFQSPTTNNTEYPLIFSFISILIIPLLTIDITSLAVRQNKITFSQQLSILKSKENITKLLVSSLVFLGFSIFLADFILVTLIITYSFFTYFSTSPYFKELDKE